MNLVNFDEKIAQNEKKIDLKVGNLNETIVELREAFRGIEKRIEEANFEKKTA